MAKPILKPICQFDEAFVTSVIKYGEKDCIVRLLLRHYGSMVFFYKNGLKIIQALGFAQVSFFLQNKQIKKLNSCSMDPSLLALGSCLKSFAYISYISEIIEIFLPEEEIALDIFDYLKILFNSIIKNGPRPELLRAFELKLLKHAGYLPELDKIFASNRQIQVAAQNLLSMPIEKILSIEKSILLEIGKIFRNRLILLGKSRLKSVEFLKTINQTSISYATNQ